MISRILIANRGEIALRILRSCKTLGIETVAVYSKPDQNLKHLKLADQSICIGPGRPKDSYLNIPALLSAAEITGADAIHPGYGFLSEQAHFAEILEKAGLIFIGPKPEHIRLMGDKQSALRQAHLVGLPILSPSLKCLENAEEAQDLAQKIGFPVILKATAGGGGKGMRMIEKAEDLNQAFQLTQQEAQNAFGQSDLYLEKYLTHPRHIEIQVLSDQHGHAVHLGLRDCSIQRMHQKVIEETPPMDLDPEATQYIIEKSLQLVQDMGYVGLGTLEFLYQDNQFYFIEMNTRVQVEHGITELVTGIDLISEQIKVAMNLPLSFTQEDIHCSGHAIECRLNAEDPIHFRPCAGTVKHFHAPGGLGIRVDSHLYSGYQVPPFYDAMIGKIMAFGATREEARRRLSMALSETVVEGINTNLPLLKRIIESQKFSQEAPTTDFLKKLLEAKN
jgi:acetyl-CoA carboxylase biotin carboxylase subunit